MPQFVFPPPNLVGDQFDAAAIPTRDARSYALRALRRFLGLLIFARPGDKPQGGARGAPLRFIVPFDNIHIYQPDSIEEAGLPGIGIRPARGRHEAYGLGPAQEIDGTQDVYGPGSFLVRKSDWVEQIAIEVLGAEDAMRTALKAGIEEALTNGEESYALRLKLPAYYDQIATFSSDEGEVLEDDPVFKNRRRADLYVTMTVPEVALVRAPDFDPSVVTDVGVNVDTSLPVETNP